MQKKSKKWQNNMKKFNEKQNNSISTEKVLK